MAEAHYPAPTPATDALPDSLDAPMQRALAGAGFTCLSDLAQATEEEVLALHGIGPKNIRLLHDALAAAGRSFRQDG